MTAQLRLAPPHTWPMFVSASSVSAVSSDGSHAAGSSARISAYRMMSDDMSSLYRRDTRASYPNPRQSWVAIAPRWNASHASVRIVSNNDGGRHRRGFSELSVRKVRLRPHVVVVLHRRRARGPARVGPSRRRRCDAAVTRDPG